MCYYLILVADEEDMLALRRELPADCELRMRSQSDSAFVPRDRRGALIVSGDCSCALFGLPGVAEQDPRRQRLERRARREGWSAAKLERAVGPTGREDKQAFEGLRPDVRRCIAQHAWATEPIVCLLEVVGRLADARWDVAQCGTMPREQFASSGMLPLGRPVRLVE